MSLQRVFEANRKQADFLWVYVKEAHAKDGPRPKKGTDIREHQSFEERTEVAGRCSAELNLTIPMLIDDMENTVGNAFSGHPDRLFILGVDGRIAYSGGKGPHQFDVKEMETALAKILASP